MSEKLLSEKIQKKNNSADNKAADVETPLKNEEGKKKNIQSTNNKKEVIYGNPDDKYKDSSSNVNELQKELEQINQSDQKSDPSNSCRKEQSSIIEIKREQNNENEESKNLFSPKEPESSFNIIKELLDNPQLKENINQKSTSILNDDKNSSQPKKKENIIVQTNNNFNKNKSRKTKKIQFLCKKHTAPDKQNISCSKKNLVEESLSPNLLSVEMRLREASVGMDKYRNQISTPNNDDNEGDNDIDKISQNGIKNCQNIDANYGLYKKECEKGMRTVNDFNLNSISLSF